MSLSDALAAIPAGTPTTIRLLGDINDSGSYTLDSLDITFDLNGFHLMIDHSGDTTQVIGATDSALSVSGGSCKLTGATANGNGSSGSSRRKRGKRYCDWQCYI